MTALTSVICSLRIECKRFLFGFVFLHWNEACLLEYLGGISFTIFASRCILLSSAEIISQEIILAARVFNYCFTVIQYF